MRITPETATPRARALAGSMRAAREHARFTGRELARRLSISHSSISHWETCRRAPSVAEAAAVLAVTGVVGEERDRVLDLARHVREPNWLTVGTPGIPQQLAGVLECERSAVAITQWAATGIPGLLQTPDYCRAIMAESGLDSTEVEHRVMLRSGRRQILTRRNPVRLEALVGEAALRDAIGDPALMRTQLCLLLEMAARPNIVLRVMPARAGWHPGHAGPFVLYDFEVCPAVLHFEHYSSGAFVPDGYDVRTYRTAIETMRAKAMGPEESAAFIARLAEEHRDDRQGPDHAEVAHLQL